MLPGVLLPNPAKTNYFTKLSSTNNDSVLRSATQCSKHYGGDGWEGVTLLENFAQRQKDGRCCSIEQGSRFWSSNRFPEQSKPVAMAAVQSFYGLLGFTPPSSYRALHCGVAHPNRILIMDLLRIGQHQVNETRPFEVILSELFCASNVCSLPLLWWNTNETPPHHTEMESCLLGGNSIFVRHSPLVECSFYSDQPVKRHHLGSSQTTNTEQTLQATYKINPSP